MTTLRDAARQALEALTASNDLLGTMYLKMDAISALRAALAQQTQAPCDIAEDGVCEVIDCCRKSPLILEALEIGYDSAQAEAAQYHAAMAGYRPERHAAMDADVEKIAKAISAVKAALAQEEPKESVRDLLIGAAAMAVAAERKGVYPGASEVADTVLAQEAETTRAQRMRDEGYTRRPTLREMVEKELEQEDIAQNLQSRLDAALLLEERRQEISQPPEALRHAQELYRRGLLEEAAELRRLYAENALLHERHHFDNGVLKELLGAMISFTNSAYIKKHHPKRYAAAMAAIAKAEGQK